MNIVIFANAIHTNTLSGGDKIFIECAKRWIDWGHSVTIVTNEAGRQYSLTNGINDAHIRLWKASWFDRFGFVPSVSIKILTSLGYCLLGGLPSADIAFASSFFLPDVIPALWLKIRHRHTRLVTASYIFTKEPFGRDYSGGKFKGFLFWINEVVSLFIVSKFGSKALTASAADRHRFASAQHIQEENVLAMRGGVDNAFFSAVAAQPLVYDAVFVGRFHPQKCVDELISIWEKVARWDNARVLALVGGGIQESELRSLVGEKHLERNVVFLGVQDGVSKAKTLKSSRLFVTASRFDTGNIALDEGLSCGLPGIIYDLPHLDYPRGVIKIPIGDSEAFAGAIIRLLADEKERQTVAADALSFARTIDWDDKARELLEFMR